MQTITKNAVNTLQYIKDSLEAWDQDLEGRDRVFALDQGKNMDNSDHQ